MFLSHPHDEEFFLTSSRASLMLRRVHQTRLEARMISPGPFRHGSDLDAQWPPPRSATSVEGGDAAQGGPRITGSARSLTAAQFASARLMYSAEFWRQASIVWDNDPPSLGIDRVLVSRLASRHAHRTVAVVLWRVTVRILDEQFAVCAVGKAQRNLCHKYSKFGLTLNGFSVGEISNWIVAADRKLGLLASRGRYKHS